ncbi:keratin-associated protein 5-1-like [Salvia splendens]|uniref:keratin-associated protein 5-1-like n=1 Tax=Salvia splendens TaxID=180675 RepID=UPI001C27D035|nr:keratin-associated protein 5-1-like [Salvia splendens]
MGYVSWWLGEGSEGSDGAASVGDSSSCGVVGEVGMVDGGCVVGCALVSDAVTAGLTPVKLPCPPIQLKFTNSAAQFLVGSCSLRNSAIASKEIIAGACRAGSDGCGFGGGCVDGGSSCGCCVSGTSSRLFEGV